MKTYTVIALEVAKLTCAIQATSPELALRMYKEGDYPGYPKREVLGVSNVRVDGYPHVKHDEEE